MRIRRPVAGFVKCASILRQWGVAFHVYADQYKGVIPHTGDRSCNPYGYRDLPYPDLAHDQQNESGGCDALAPLLGLPPRQTFPEHQRPTGGLWQCPLAFAWPDSSYGYAPSQYGWHSSAANIFLDEDDTIHMPAGFILYPSFLQLGQAQPASVTLLMFENTLNPLAGNGQQPNPSVSCLDGLASHESAASFCDRHSHAPHKLGGNVMMLDGHVEWTDHLWDRSLADPSTPPTTDRRWFP